MEECAESAHGDDGSAVFILPCVIDKKNTFIPSCASEENSADHSTKVVLLAVTLRRVIVCNADM